MHCTVPELEDQQLWGSRCQHEAPHGLQLGPHPAVVSVVLPQVAQSDVQPVRRESDDDQKKTKKKKKKK